MRIYGIRTDQDRQAPRHSKNVVTMVVYIEVPPAATHEALEKLGQWIDSDS